MLTHIVPSFSSGRNSLPSPVSIPDACAQQHDGHEYNHCAVVRAPTSETAGKCA